MLHRKLHAGAVQDSGYSSPPCYAREIAPDYFGEAPIMSAEDIVRFLNTLLERSAPARSFSRPS